MKKILALCVMFMTLFVGCPLGGGSSEENAKVSELLEYCPRRCLKIQECRPDLFDIKWNSLEACEKECDPRTEANTCSAACDVEFAADQAAKEDCVLECRNEVSVEGCKHMCEGISDQYYHDRCIGSCNREFSQSCADATANMHECYLNLECDQAKLFKDFGGSAADVGACGSGSSVGANC